MMVLEQATADVLGDFDFLRKDPVYQHQKPFLVLLPPDFSIDPSVPRSNLMFETHTLKAHDVRNDPAPYRLEECGFEYVRHVTTVRALSGLPTLSPTLNDVAAYKKETEELLKERLGAVHVVCYNFRMRENIADDRLQIDLNDLLLREGPAKGAHTDVTARSGPEMIMNRLSREDFAKYRTPDYRFRIVNTWRPLNSVCEDNPIALCDYRTVHPNDLIAADRVIPERAGEVYYVHHNPDQRWCWLSKQTPEEPAIFLMYDDLVRGDTARYCPHVSFYPKGLTGDVPPRRSVETRSVVISKMTQD